MPSRELVNDHTGSLVIEFLPLKHCTYHAVMESFRQGSGDFQAKIPRGSRVHWMLTRQSLVQRETLVDVRRTYVVR